MAALPPVAFEYFNEIEAEKKAARLAAMDGEERMAAAMIYFKKVDEERKAARAAEVEIKEPVPKAMKHFNKIAEEEKAQRAAAMEEEEPMPQAMKYFKKIDDEEKAVLAAANASRDEAPVPEAMLYFNRKQEEDEAAMYAAIAESRVAALARANQRASARAARLSKMTTEGGNLLSMDRMSPQKRNPRLPMMKWQLLPFTSTSLIRNSRRRRRQNMKNTWPSSPHRLRCNTSSDWKRKRKQPRRQLKQ